MAPLDRDVDVAQHPDRGGALAVAGVDVAHLQRGRFAPVLVQRLVALSGGGRRAHGGHQPSRVVVAGPVDDLVGGALLLDVSGVEHHDVVRDLRDHGEIVRHVDRGRPLLLDHRLERLEHLDLGGDVERGGRLVQNQQVRLAAQRHGGHQALQLAAGHLVGIALAQTIRIGKLQRPVELLGPDFGPLPAQLPVEDGGLGHLLADGERGIEGGGGALREVGDPLPAKVALLVRRHGDDVAAVQPDLAAGELEAGLAVPERGERDGGLARSRLADQRHHLPALDVEAHALDDGRERVVVLAGVDLQAVDLEQRRHQIILLASRPPAWAETSSTIRLMAMVRVAMATAGTSGAMAP